MSTPSPTFGQQILTLIESDILISFSGPLLSFLTAVQTAAGDPIKISTAFIALQGNIVGAAPSSLGALESQIAGSLAAKLTALQASLKPA